MKLYKISYRQVYLRISNHCDEKTQKVFLSLTIFSITSYQHTFTINSTHTHTHGDKTIHNHTRPQPIKSLSDFKSNGAHLSYSFVCMIFSSNVRLDFLLKKIKCIYFILNYNFFYLGNCKHMIHELKYFVNFCLRLSMKLFGIEHLT